MRCERLRATVACCHYETRTPVVIALGLFWVGVAVAALEIALIPTPTFLYDVTTFSHEGMALLLWCIVFAVCGFLSSICVDAFGHKRIYAYGLIIGLFGLGSMILATAMHPHPTASPFFWASTCVGALAMPTIVLAGYAAVSAFAGKGMSRKFALGAAVALYSLGIGVGGALSIPPVKHTFATLLAASVPSLEHARTNAALIFGGGAMMFGLLTIPLVRKHRRLSRSRSGFSKAWRPLANLDFWRLVGFSVSWTGAKVPAATAFYLLPVYLARADLLPGGAVNAGYLVLFVYGAMALLAVPMQMLLTTTHPLFAIALGAALSSLAPWWLMWKGAGVWAVVIAGSAVVIGESIWWPRFLAYSSDVAPEQVHVGMHMSVVIGIEALARGFVAVIGPLLLQEFCPAEAGAPCNSVALWGVVAAISSGWSLLALLFLKCSHDPAIKRAWKSEIKLDTYENPEKQFADESGDDLAVTLEDSVSYSSGAEPYPDDDADDGNNGNPFSGIGVSLEAEDLT